MMRFFDSVPKIELHIHLEGAIPHPALFHLIQKYGGNTEIPDLPSLEKRFQYKSFPEFISTFAWKNGFLREYEDFTHIAQEVAYNLSRQNIIYAEMFYSPTSFVHNNNLSLQRLTEAIRLGFDQVPAINIRLIADFVRDYGPEHEISALPALAEVRNLGVLGISIGGSEHAFPPEPFAPLYEEARRLGFKTTVHAGEAAGPESIWGAIRTLRPDRIGHGTRAIEDPLLVDYLVRHRIPVELCPGSNVRTKVVSSLRKHPVREYFKRGMLISINTDDPWMFQTRLADEYRALEESCGFSRQETLGLMDMAREMCWENPLSHNSV
ncbi:adenosine deaminase [bacterium]|nr:adenosine deaminase [bacterium]